MQKKLQTLHKKLTIWLNKLTEITGSPYLFAILVLLIAAWFVVGIFFRYSDSWFNIMDIFVFLTTFFLVFIVQSTQNADTQALQDKLDEVISALPKASNKVKAEEKKIKRDEKSV